MKLLPFVVFQFLTWLKKGIQMAQIKITLTKSPIGRIPSQRKTVVALELQIEQLVIKDNPAVPWYDHCSISLGNS